MTTLITSPIIIRETTIRDKTTTLTTFPDNNPRNKE